MIPVQIRYWRKYDDNEAAASRVLVHSSVNQTRLENMRPDSHYLIEVRAYNGAGLGPPSEHCEMFTRRPRKHITESLGIYAQCKCNVFINLQIYILLVTREVFITNIM